MINLIVLMKCQAKASQKDIEAIFAALATLWAIFRNALAFEGGANNSPEEFGQRIYARIYHGFC